MGARQLEDGSEDEAGAAEEEPGDEAVGAVQALVLPAGSSYGVEGRFVAFTKARDRTLSEKSDGEQSMTLSRGSEAARCRARPTAERS